MDIYDLKEEYSTVLTVLRTQKPVVNRCDRFKIRTGKDLTTINSAYPLKINGELYGAVVFESDLSVIKQIKNRTLDLETYVESDKHKDSEKLYTFDNIIYSSKNMEEMIHFAKKVSLTDSSILIVGATGTGKELVAQSIHSFSPRRKKPFIDVNCSAVPSNLFESMFFGTEKGAFTGSIAKQGFFEMANGGTLFLDEVNSINPEMQAKLLRVLQEKRFQRIGGSQYIRCNVRIIAAINEDPFKLIEQEKMRKDFYYRISTIKINVPTLQERKEDIAILAKYFLNKLCSDYSRRELNLTEKFMSALGEYEWPGNIRELQNVIEYSFNRVSENAQLLDFEHLPDYLQFTETITHRIASQYNKSEVKPESIGTLEEQMEEVERTILINTLNLYSRNITRSAKALGMSRQSLQYRIKKLNILN
ncbi:Arginine utilization regulatory protein RocR [bioreactor metagenome]|uniref:Arginine utilization regulatory protein RocR n=2 Tax=root TaxID=1 RepID=A0A645CZM3_9ZZZZ